LSGRLASLTGGHPRSLTLALYRHAAILVVAAAVIVGLGYAMPITDQQPVAWLVAAAVLGLLAALVSGWYGLIFLVAGLAIGIVLSLALQDPATSHAVDQLTVAGPWYLAVLVVATVAFAITRLLVARLLRR
jgi:hypothetical protein